MNETIGDASLSITNDKLSGQLSWRYGLPLVVSGLWDSISRRVVFQASNDLFQILLIFTGYLFDPGDSGLTMAGTFTAFAHPAIQTLVLGSASQSEFGWYAVGA